MRLLLINVQNHTEKQKQENKKMAAIKLLDRCTCVVILFLPVIFSLAPCTKDDFGEYKTECKSGTKKIVHYMHNFW